MMLLRSRLSPKRGLGASAGLLLALCLAAGTAAQAADSGLVLSRAWFRMVMPSLPAAGYFTLSNPTGTAQVLVGAASPACGMLMLHQSVNQGGQERMAMVKSVAIPVHGKIAFAPGGYHLMCMSPTAAMKRGNTVPVTLHFEDGTTLTANFPVRNATGK